jgi:hypothetical protein
MNAVHRCGCGNEVRMPSQGHDSTIGSASYFQQLNASTPSHWFASAPVRSPPPPPSPHRPTSTMSELATSTPFSPSVRFHPGELAASTLISSSVRLHLGEVTASTPFSSVTMARRVSMQPPSSSPIELAMLLLLFVDELWPLRYHRSSH